MGRFASEPCYKSSSERLWSSLLMLVLHPAMLTFSSSFAPHWSSITEAALAISLCLASVNSDFPWPLTPRWNAHGLYASLGPYSPLPISLPSWHWAARQYFPSVEWRAWHRQFDAVSETTVNQRCTTYFYSTNLREPKEIRGLSARLNTEPGFQKQRFLPKTLNMFYIQARNVEGWNNLRMNLIGSCLEMCEQASLSCTSCFLSSNVYWMRDQPVLVM